MTETKEDRVASLEARLHRPAPLQWESAGIKFGWCRACMPKHWGETRKLGDAFFCRPCFFMKIRATYDEVVPRKTP